MYPAHNMLSVILRAGYFVALHSVLLKIGTVTSRRVLDIGPDSPIAPHPVTIPFSPANVLAVAILSSYVNRTTWDTKNVGEICLKPDTFELVLSGEPCFPRWNCIIYFLGADPRIHNSTYFLFCIYIFENILKETSTLEEKSCYELPQTKLYSMGLSISKDNKTTLLDNIFMWKIVLITRLCLRKSLDLIIYN